VRMASPRKTYIIIALIAERQEHEAMACAATRAF
jgi:hypothetical protein